MALNDNKNKLTAGINVLFDSGNGFDVVLKHTVEKLVEENNFLLEIPDNVKAVRMCFENSELFLLKNFVVFSDHNKLDFWGNYISKDENSSDLLFFNNDPCVEFNVTEEQRTVRIKFKFVTVLLSDENEISLGDDDSELSDIDLSDGEDVEHYKKLVIALNNALAQKNNIIDEKDKKLDKLGEEYINTYKAYANIANSSYWRITYIPRKATEIIKNTLAKIPFLIKSVIYLKGFLRGGFKGGRAQLDDYILSLTGGKPDHSIITKAVRKEQEKTKFSKKVKFSVLVPLYNTPENFLIEMIESVQKQTYRNWELCLADGSTEDFAYVGNLCKKLAKKDKRIVYKKLEKNLGISENTNECIKMATGDYIALFDHDDVLHPSALFECMKQICDNGADYLYTDEATFLGDDITEIITFHYKPDFSPYNLLANNYICHFSVFSAKLIDKVGMFRNEYDGSQDHDMILRLTDAAENVVHIPKLLYFWRSHANSVAMDINSKAYAIKAGQNAVHDFLLTKGINSEVSSSPAFPTIYRIKYDIKDNPLVSIIIPNKDHYEDLFRCVSSIKEKSTYKNYEIVIVDNGSTEQDVKQYYIELEKENNVKVLSYDYPFNYSAINNYAVSSCDGDYLLLLNNDTEVITPEWIEELLMLAQKDDVGAVGAKLFFADKTVQHGGIVLKLGQDRIAGHSHMGADYRNPGYMGKMFYTQNISAVTAACLMVKKSKYLEVGGFDEEQRVAYNDVDFCLKLDRSGLKNIFNPFCEMYHYESRSRGLDTKSENTERFIDEAAYFKEKWKEKLEAGDPYYNPNFSLDASYELK